MNKLERWELYLLGAILLAALALRCGFVSSHQYIFDDSRDYLALAGTILSGQDYQVHGLYATRMPGYPVLLAGLLWLRPSFAFILYAQAIIGGLSCGVLYLIGRRLSPWIGLIGAALLAVDPLQIGFCAAILTEIPFTLVLLVTLWLLTRLLTDRQLIGWPLLGLVWGVAIYLRAAAFWLIWPLGLTVVVAWVVLSVRQDGLRWHATLRRGLMGFLFAWVVVLATLYPWNVRNTARFGPHHWLTTLEGISLYEAVYPQADGGPRQDKILVPPALAAPLDDGGVGEVKGVSEAQLNDEWMTQAKTCLWQEPGRMLHLAFVKIGRTWSPLFHAGQDGGPDAGFQNAPVQGVLASWSVLTYLLAIVGMALVYTRNATPVTRASRPPSDASGAPTHPPARTAETPALRQDGVYLGLLILLPIVYFTLLHAVFIGSVRYRVPVLPLVDLLAALGIVGLWQALRRRGPDSPTK